MNIEQRRSSVQIRLAVPEDASSIASVLHNAFIEYKPLYTREGFIATTPVAAEVKNRIDEGPVWVVSDNDAIVGTVSVVPKGESLYVRGMAVVPAARGGRIGELLLRQVEDFAAERGFKRLKSELQA